MKVTVVTRRGYVFDGEATQFELDCASATGCLELKVVGGKVRIQAIDHITVPNTKEITE
jgi:hypothetical protein